MAAELLSICALPMKLTFLLMESRTKKPSSKVSTKQEQGLKDISSEWTKRIKNSLSGIHLDTKVKGQKLRS